MNAGAITQAEWCATSTSILGSILRESQRAGDSFLDFDELWTLRDVTVSSNVFRSCMRLKRPGHEQPRMLIEAGLALCFFSLLSTVVGMGGWGAQEG